MSKRSKWALAAAALAAFGLGYGVRATIHSAPPASESKVAAKG